MKTTFRLMSLILLATVSTGFAWSGGPWSGNTADNTAGKGSYQGTMRGKNLLGVFQFQNAPDLSATTDGTTSSLTGLKNVFTVFIAGKSVRGLTHVSLDSASRSVSGVFEGSSTGEQTLIVSTSSVNTVEQTQYNIENPSSGSFSATITSTKPQLRFKGKGEFAVTSGVDVSSEDFGDTDITSIETNTDALTFPMKIAGVRTSLLTSVSSDSSSN